MADFDPGDVVVCVNTRPWGNHLFRDRPMPLILMRTYRVTEVRRTMVAVAEFPKLAFLGDRFRKIRPADEAFTRQMRALKPIKQPSRELVDSIPVHPRGDTL